MDEGEAAGQNKKDNVNNWKQIEKDEKVEKDCTDFDDILEIVGSQEKYQKFLLYGILSPIIAIVPLFIMNGIFMLYEPDHWCHVPGRLQDVEIDVWKNLTIPREIGADGRERFSQCFMFSSNDTGDKVSCLNGWDYDRTDYDETIPSKLDWVCDKSEYATNALTMGGIGAGIGTIIFGPAADKYGRKPIFILICIMNLVVRIISLFVVEYLAIFLTLQVLIGASLAFMPIAPSLIVAEVSGKDFRAWVYSLTWITWVIGMAALPFLAWLSRTWFNLGVVTTIPCAFILLSFWWLPESPRWLILKGRAPEAASILLKIASFNGKSEQVNLDKINSMLNELMIKQQEKTQSQEKTTGIWTLFSKPRLAKHTIILTICWAIDSLIYEGITLNATRLSGNQFLNFFILAIVEVPSGFLGGFLANKIGRRWTHVLFFTFCTLTCLGTAFVSYTEPDLTGLVMACIVTAKFSINLAFLVVYIQAMELFPTELRSTGFGFSATVSCIVTVVGPYLVYLGTISSAAPYILLGGISALGTISSVFLPETLNQKLPETVEEADMFGQNQTFWDFTMFTKRKSIIVNSKENIQLNDIQL